MSANTTKKPIFALVILVLLVAVSIPFQNKIDDIRGKFRSVEGSLYLPSSSLKKISMGYYDLLADIYWLKVLQYFGRKKPKEQNPELLYHYFDIITDLDPKFVNAYRYGGTFLAEDPPFGLGETKKGIELLDKGRKNNPDNYRLPLEEAFIYYFHLKDYEKVAELFKEASEKTEISPLRKASLKDMAASAHANGGNRELSRKIWEIIYETSPSEGRRNFALGNLKEIDTMIIEDKLTDSLRKYVRIHGKLPSATKDLVRAGIVKDGIPASPVGGEFIIAPKIQSVKNTALADQQIKQDLDLLNSKAARFKNQYGTFPKDMEELKNYLVNETLGDFPSHPLGEEYIYDPETGKVKSIEEAE